MPIAKNNSRPLPSSTVVVLRDQPGGLEVLLVLRHNKASFGASYVFPGGVQEMADATIGDCCDGQTDACANADFGLQQGGLAYYSAGLRELFEETGVLIARQAGSEGDARLVNHSQFEEYRQPLHDGALDWREFLHQQTLRLAFDQMHYFAYWVTPRFQPKRFSTRFFLAAMPPGQVAVHDGKELTDSQWLTPATALQAAKDKTMRLPPPTQAVLKDLCLCGNVSAALEWAHATAANGVGCVLPAIVGEGPRMQVLLPGSPDYPSDHLGCEE